MISFGVKGLEKSWYAIKQITNQQTNQLTNQTLVCIPKNSIKHQSFVYTLLSDQTVLFKTIQFSISHWFTLSLDIKKFYFTFRKDLIRFYHSGPEWTWEQWQRRGTPHFANLQHYWSFTIWLFTDISRTTLVCVQGGGLTVPYSQLMLCAKWTYNVHKDRFRKNLGISEFENTQRLLVQVRNFFINFELKVST